MVPYVGTPGKRVRSERDAYPPRGVVVASSRAQRSSPRTSTYLGNAHEWLVTLTQTRRLCGGERRGVAAVDGVDVRSSPHDLTTSWAYRASTEIRAFTELKTVADARECGKAAGSLLDRRTSSWRELGYTVIALGSTGGAVVRDSSRVGDAASG